MSRFYAINWRSTRMEIPPQASSGTISIIAFSSSESWREPSVKASLKNLSSSPASGIQWSSSSVAIEEAMKQPLCQYEQGSECYENLKATIYNSKYPVRQLLQGLLDNKCCFIALSVIGDDEEKWGGRRGCEQLSRFHFPASWWPTMCSSLFDYVHWYQWHWQWGPGIWSGSSQPPANIHHR